ncbi:MAG: hypothetical protein R6V57_05575 [Vicinamibacterales bacterium]
MKQRMGALGEALERLLPFLTFVVVFTAGWFWLVQPRFDAYLRARTDAAALEERARTMQQASERGHLPPPADLERAPREFEARVSPDDKVADVAAAIAHAVLANAPAGKLRAFVIETGDRTSQAPHGGSAGQARASTGPGVDGADPRLALFPYAVSSTPLRVTFDSTFEAAGDLLWQLRDLPTLVEVRSAALTRGLPLMRTELLVRVLQRGEAILDGTPAMTAPEGPAAPGQTGPRLAPPAAGPGVMR